MPLSTSVVLCTCNGARYLRAQWDSLLAQTRLPDEIVVRDDASSDATPALLDDLARAATTRGVSLRLSRNPRNLGYVANFEAALRDATGEVLLLCDQDDVWHSDKLAVLAEQFERRRSLLLLCTDARRVDAAGEPLQRSLFQSLKLTHVELRRIHAGQGFEVLLRRSLATGATVALRRSLLADALPFPQGWVHDEWLAIMAAARGGFDCMELSLVDYRQHATNQIGMPDRGLAAKWHDLRRPRAALIEGLIARNETLLQRLQSLGNAVPAIHAVQTLDKLHHLRVRSAVHGPPWKRLGRVLRESLNGHYRVHGTGWRSALRDLLRRD
ncbi:MAG: glycosyltransferase family 2 protein [Rhodanobacteraceae bacterium]|nr:MAG: glycosyltransferase family 2 protein [Rhodanobacteraceae bacterium]